MTHAQGYALLILVVLVWAGNFPLAKAGLGELGPLTLAATRAAITAPVICGFVRLAHGRWPRLRRRDRVTFAVLSLAGLVGNTTTWYWGLRYTTPANAGIVGAISPVLVAVVAARWLGDPLSRANVVGIGLTAIAVILTITRGSLEVLRTLAINPGDFIILFSQILWATYTLYVRATTSTLPPVVVQAGAYAVSASLLVPLSLVERPWESLSRAGILGWGAVLYAAGLGTASHVWYYRCIRVVGAGRAAVFTNLTPFAVIALSWLTLGEAIGWYHLAGATIVIAGVFLTTRRG